MAQRPQLFEAITKHANADALKMFNQTMVIDGEGALKRIQEDGWGVLKDLPAVTPPYRYTFIDFGFQHSTPNNRRMHAGAMVILTDDEELRVQYREGKLEYNAPKLPEDNVRWGLHVVVFLDSVPVPELKTAIGYTTALIAENGLPLMIDELYANENPFPFGDAIITPGLLETLAAAIHRQNPTINIVFDKPKLTRLITDAALASMFVFGLLHCRNIQLSEPKVSRKVQKKREKHQRPLERFYILKVTGKGSFTGYNPLRQATGRHNSLHWCRGHFRTYTEDAPLFGKHIGTFWVDPHIKGNRGVGIVNKDYKVDPNIPITDG